METSEDEPERESPRDECIQIRWKRWERFVVCERSVHEGLGFTKWKRALEREFPETMKVQGGPGEGNIRGIGGEQRVAYKNIEGVGKMEGRCRFGIVRVLADNL
jgi:hypothetical protein